jgi:hypothetical protein
MLTARLPLISREANVSLITLLIGYGRIRHRLPTLHPARSVDPVQFASPAATTGGPSSPHARGHLDARPSCRRRSCSPPAGMPTWSNCRSRSTPATWRRVCGRATGCRCWPPTPKVPVGGVRSFCCRPPRSSGSSRMRPGSRAPARNEAYNSGCLSDRAPVVAAAIATARIFVVKAPGLAADPAVVGSPPSSTREPGPGSEPTGEGPDDEVPPDTSSVDTGSPDTGAPGARPPDTGPPGLISGAVTR